MRYPPISESERTAAQRDVASAITSGPRGELRGPFVPLLYSPALAGKVQELGEVIRFGTGIPDALLEIAVLLTARHHDCPNIWESHSVLAQKAGVAREIILAISERRLPLRMNDDESLIVAFCAQLHETNTLSDATFEAVTARWGKKGAMELAGVCGYYGMLATVLNVAQPPLKPDTVPFDC